MGYLQATSNEAVPDHRRGMRCVNGILEGEAGNAASLDGTLFRRAVKSSLIARSNVPSDALGKGLLHTASAPQSVT